MSPARRKLEGVRAASMERARQRLMLVLMLFAGAFLVMAGRTVELGLLEPINEPMAMQSEPAGIAKTRADIVDRNGEVLATNLEVSSLYANPSEVLDPAGAAAALVRALPGLTESAVRAKLESSENFVWIKRKLTPEQIWRVNALGLPGLAFQREEERIYPHGRLAAHAVGFTDTDGTGLAGIERSFNDRLSDPDRVDEPLALSLDIRVQHALRDEMRASRERFSAKAAAGMVMDVDTGELLAMASLPDFDPQHASGAGDAQRFNRVSQGVYELGSIFKAFTVAMALESGTADLSDRYDAREPLQTARFTIHDDHPQNRRLSVPEIFIHSSNIGAAKMALDAGAKRQRAFFDAAGLTRPARIELAEVGRPILPSRWREVNTMTAAFGHGIAVSPLQTATAVAAIVNDGDLIPATLVAKAEDYTPPAERLLSQSTSRTMRGLMRLVVTQGTGENAEVDGYRVAGKTGTAEKSGPGGYRDEAVRSSFVGVFPGEDPQYLVFILLDEPQGIEATHGYATGGWTAAPAVGRVIERIAPILGIAPQAERPDMLHRASLDLSEPSERLP